MFRRTTISTPILLVLVLIGLGLPIGNVAAAPATASPYASMNGAALKRELLECYNGAVPPESAFCVVQPILGAGDATVTMEVRFAGRTRTYTAQQPVNAPVGSNAAAARIGDLGVLPGDTFQMRISAGDQDRDFLVGFQPDPTTRIHLLPTLDLSVEQLNPAAIWGTVNELDNTIAIADLEVKLYTGDSLLASSSTITPTNASEPIFSFNPTGLLNEQPLRLETTYKEVNYRTDFQWLGQPIQVSFVLGWPCDGELPRRGGSTSLPPLFCLTTVVYDGDETVEGAQVFIEAGGDVFGPLTTKTGDSGVPLAAAEIGAAMQAGGTAGLVRVIAVAERNVGIFVAPAAELGLGTRWGNQVRVSLQSDVLAAMGLRGGRPGAIARTGETTLIGGWGGLLVQNSADSDWLRVWFNQPPLSAPPEVTALFADPNRRVIGFANGAALISIDNGQSWQSLLAPTTRPVRGITADADRMYLVRGSQLLQVDASLEASPIDTLSFIPTALAHLSDGSLIAGSQSGVQRLIGDDSWQTITDQPVTALAHLDFAGRPWLLIGTATGLSIYGPTGEMRNLGVTTPVFGIHTLPTAEGWDIAVTTIDGVRRGIMANADATPEFTLSVGGNDLQAAEIATAGSNLPNPDVNDLLVTPEMIVAATATGVYTSSDHGLNWNATIPSISGNVRSTALLDDVILALQADRLQRLRDGAWDTFNSLPTPLNGMVVRTSGTFIALGRDAGPGASLYLSSDAGANWAAVSLGLNRGVVDIAALDATNTLRFVVATNGDGLYGVTWNNGSFQVEAMPDLTDSNGGAARISAVHVIEAGGTCRLVVGTIGGDAGVAARPCDITSNWSTSLVPLRIDGQGVGIVRTLLQLDPNRILAATGSGFVLGDPTNIAGTWSASNFGTPARASELALPADFATMRRYLSGGAQSGVLLLSDVAPDLAVNIDVQQAASPARGNTVITPTVIFRNQGLLPTTSVTYTITTQTAQREALTGYPAVESDQVPELLSGETFTVPMQITLNRETRPGDLAITAMAPRDEQFSGNNRADVVIKLDYRDAPDLRPLISGDLQLDLNEPGAWLLHVLNLGTKASDASTVTVDIPAGLTVTAPLNAELNGRVLTWDVPALAVGEHVTLPISYTINLASGTDPEWPLTARLTTSGDDREPLNNSDTVTVTLRPSEPQGVIVMYSTRQESSGLGPMTELRPLINRIAQRERLLIFDLSSEPSCATDPAGIDCRFSALDEAQAEVAGASTDASRDAEMAELLTVAIESRRAAVAEVQQRIAALLPDTTPNPYVYLIGGDAVIPMDVSPDISTRAQTLGQSVTPEEAYAAALPPNDSLFAVFRANYYPHYASYQRIGDRNVRFGVQVGDAATIAPVLRTFVDAQGNLNIYQAVLSGIAEDLTGDTQAWLCAELNRVGLQVLATCNDIDPSANAGLSQFAANRLAVISGHATSTQIEDLLSTQIQAVDIEKLNMLLILLGCHSGLSPNPTLGEVRSLVEALSEKGIPTFGFSAYAYAQKDNVNVTGNSAYAEQLVRYLSLQLATADGESLGTLVHAARLHYSKFDLIGDPVGLHRKTLDTLTLYGPPMYRVRTVTSPTQPLVSTQTEAGRRPLPPPPPVTLSITPTYEMQQLPEGVIYLARMSNAESLVLVEMGQTMQPAIIYTLPEGITGALIDGGIIEVVGVVDPVVPRIAPLQSSNDYTEPAPFNDSGWAFVPRVRTNEDGKPVLVMPLGSWNLQNAEQSLIRTIDLELTEPVDPNAEPPQLTAQPVLCMLGPELNITLDDGVAIERVEVVSISSSGMEVYPLRLTGDTWRTRVPIPATTQLFLQALGTNGTTIFITDGVAPYIAPGKMPPCQPT